MHRLRVLLGILVALLILQGVGLMLLALIVYQATPNSVLARDTIIGRMPGVLATVRLIDRASNVMYRGPTQPEALPAYSLEIAKKDLQKIEEALPTELPSSWYGNLFLTDDAKKWVKGTFVADEEEYEVKVRVRGDLFNHWSYRKKSWRIKFPKDKLFRGMRAINLIIPEDRGWIAEPLNVYRAQKLGLLHPPVRFVTLSLNGSSPMVYTEIEHWTKQMLEKQGRPGDVNLYQTGGGSSTFQQWDAVFTNIAYWDKYEKSDAPFDSYEEIDLMLNLSRLGAHEEPGYLEKLQSVFDLDQLVTWYGHSLLSGSRHFRDHNLRFLFDVSRGRFEPIPWDVSLYWPRTLFALPGNPFFNEVFRVPELRLATHRFLWNYINDEEQVNSDLAQAQHLRSLVERAAYRDSSKLPSNRQVYAELNEREKQVQANFDFLKKELSLSEVLIEQRIPSIAEQEKGILLTIDLTARGTVAALLTEIAASPSLIEAFEDESIVLLRDDGNDTPIPLAIRREADENGHGSIVLTNENLALVWPGDPEIGPNEEIRGAPHTRHRFFLARKRGSTTLSNADLPLQLDVRNAVTGEKANVINEVIIDERTFERLEEAYASREEFLARYPFFSAEGEEGALLEGVLTLNETVIVPSTVRLRIAPGTTVRLGSGVSLLSYAPVMVVGDSNNRIRFEAATSNPWGVFAVLNATEPSKVRWVEFSDGSQAFINDTFISGMVAFHGSPVSVADSVFRYAHGDDALNLKYVEADVVGCRFEENSADGLDIDVATGGKVEDSVFLSNGNDGIDLSWSPITIRNVTIKDSPDKCISVGERSMPIIEDTTLEGCDIGLAVKDGSKVIARRISFFDNETAISAYVKKPIFSAPTVDVTESTFRGNKVQEDAQNGAVITINSSS